MGASRKGGKMACLTKEQLTVWRQQGKTNVQIAEMTGQSAATVNGLFSRYKIPPRSRGIPQETKETILRMKGSGSSIKRSWKRPGFRDQRYITMQRQQDSYRTGIWGSRMYSSWQRHVRRGYPEWCVVEKDIWM